MIAEDGEQIGILDVLQAIQLAEERGLDLVEMSATSHPPTCRLMDFGKYKYEQKKKSHGQKKTIIKRKEIKLRPKTGDGDFHVKIERARKFLAKGHKVIVTMIFRGREMAHIDLGRVLLDRFAKTLEGCAKLEKPPTREGRNRMDMLLGGK